MDFEDFIVQLDEVVRAILPLLRDHIFKENNILYPTALEIIDDNEVWSRLKDECNRIGYCSFLIFHGGTAAGDDKPGDYLGI
jgi:hypothetical protein